MSAPVSPVCGRAAARLSIFTASTRRRAATGSPVNGEYSWDERPGPGAAGGAGCPPSTTTSDAARPMAAAAADVPIAMFRRDHLMVIASSRRRLNDP